MIEVSMEPEPQTWGAIEHCCFCRKPTRYWFVPKDVACCRECAKSAEPKDVPSKKVWWTREQIATGTRSER